MGQCARLAQAPQTASRLFQSPADCLAEACASIFLAAPIFAYRPTTGLFLALTCQSWSLGRLGGEPLSMSLAELRAHSASSGDSKARRLAHNSC